MKTLKTQLVRGLFMITLFTGTTVVLSTIGVQTVSQAMAASQQQVSSYLTTNGYTIITLNPKSGTKYDWVAQTTKNGVSYMTTVHCDATSIISHEDILL